MGVEKERFDALAALYRGLRPPPDRFGPIRPNGSENQRALGLACWYWTAPPNFAPSVCNFYGNQLKKGMWGYEPNSTEYHHLHSGAAWAIFMRARRAGDLPVKEVLRQWLRNDLAASILFGCRYRNTVRVVAPGARVTRLQSLSRDIQLQQVLGYPAERRRGHLWWALERERRESLGATIQLALRAPLLTAAERMAARAWIAGRHWSPEMQGLVSPLRYRSELRIVDVLGGWYAFFPELHDCWDNAQPAVAVQGYEVRRLRARDDSTRRALWHQGPVTTRLDERLLVSQGKGHRGSPPVFDWSDQIRVPPGTPGRTISIGPTGVALNGQPLPLRSHRRSGQLANPPAEVA